MIFLLILLNPVDDFRVLQGLFNDSMYEAAEKEMVSFLNQYPKNQYSSDVAVLLLKTFEKEKKYRELIKISNEFLRKFPEKKDDIIVLKGTAEMSIGKTKSAISTFSRLGGEKKYLYIGDVYYNTGDYRKATNYFRKTKSDYGRFSLGWCYYKMRDFEKAKKEFSSLRGVYKEDGEYMVARISFENNEEDGESQLLNYLAKYKNGKYRARAYILLAEHAENNGDWQKAEGYLNSIVKEHLSFTDYAFYRKGFHYYKAGNFEKAISTFKKINKESDYYPDAEYYTALSHKGLGRETDAVSMLSRLGTEYPLYKGKANFRIGEILMDKGKDTLAFRSFLSVQGEFRQPALINAGNIELEMGNTDSALSLYEKAIELNGKYTDAALLQKAIAYYKKGEDLRAKKILSELVKVGKGKIYFKSNLLLGDIFIEESDYENAINYYNNVIRSANKEFVPFGLEGKGWALVGAHQYNRAFIVLDSLTSEYPAFKGKGYIYLTMGDAAYSMKDWKHAISAYKRVKGEKEPEAIFKLGMVYFDKGDYDRATETFLRLKRKYPLYEKIGLSEYMTALSLRKMNDLLSSSIQAKSLIKQAVSRDIKFKSYILIGDNFYDQAKFDSSLFYYKKAMNLFKSPSSNILPAIKGVLYSIFRKEGVGKAVTESKNYMSRYKDTPIYEEIRITTANLLIDDGRYGKAIEMLKDTGNGRGLLLLGFAYRKVGKDSLMVISYERARRFAQSRNKATQELTKYFLKKNNYEKVLEYAKSIPGIEGKMYVVKALFGMNKLDEALSMLKGIKGRFYGNGYLYIGKIYLKKGKTEDAITMLDSASAYQDVAPEAIYLKAKTLYDEGRYDDAKSLLLKVRYLYPESPFYSPSLLLLSRILIKSGDKEKARKFLKEVIDRKDGYEKEANSILVNIH